MKSPENNPLNSGLFEAINNVKKQQEELAQSLEGLPVEQEHFSVPEIEKIIEIRKGLGEIIQESKTGASRPKDYVNKAESYLDGLDAWIFKFSTGDRQKPKDTDSLYYVMSNGVSLRLKRVNEDKGMSQVVQPFMECIYFLGDSRVPTEHLTLGATPVEYCSKEFYDLQNQNNAENEFVSPVKKFYKDGKLHFVTRPENMHHEHPGNEINKVYWSNI
jgi:hypothetical protein